MSILETKIRKKIMLISSDGRGLFKKMKNMDILRRLITENKVDKVGGLKYQRRHAAKPEPSVAKKALMRILKRQSDSKDAAELLAKSA